MPSSLSAAHPRLHALFLMLALALLAGCAEAPLKPTVVQASLDATQSLNPDSRGRASPVVVRIFELKSVAAFNRGDFFSLWDRESETLGAELVSRDEILMRPGEEKQLKRTLQPDTRHLAVIAAFRDLEHAQWRGAVAVLPNQTQPITIKLDARSVTVSGS